MKSWTCMLVGIALLLAVFAPAWGQEEYDMAGAHAAYAEPAVYSNGLGLGSVVMSSGFMGILIWLGMLFWAVAALPLGIVSVIHAATIKTRQLPLATKLLACGGIWVLLLGLLGAVQGAIYSLSTLATMAAGAAASAILALNISQALYSVAAALFLCQGYLFLFVISIGVAHFRHRRLAAGA